MRVRHHVYLFDELPSANLMRHAFSIIDLNQWALLGPERNTTMLARLLPRNMTLSAGSPHSIEDRGPAAVAIYWIQIGIASIVVAARFYIRKRMTLTGPDDWLMLVTLVSFAIHTMAKPCSHWCYQILFGTIASVVTWDSTLGGFCHLPDVPVQRITKVALLVYIGQDLTIFCYVTGKASVGCLILRFLGPKTVWRR